MLLALLHLALAADPDAEARARVLYDNGRQLYEEGLYNEAILAFNEAYMLTERAPLLYNIASCYERMGRWQEAIDTLNLYRVYAKAEDRETLEQRILSLQRRLAEEQAATPTPPAPGATDPAAADPAAADPAAADPAAVEPSVEPESELRPERRLLPWLLVGVGGASGLVFGTVAGVTWAQGRSDRLAHDQLAWEARRPLNNLSFGVAVTGGAIAATGLLLVVLGGSPTESSPTEASPTAASRLQLSVGPGSLTVRF